MWPPSESAAYDVVIVTPTYLSSNPRVVKEAEALAAAGLHVAAVFSQGPAMWARPEDVTVSAGRPWQAVAHSWSWSVPGERATYAWSTARYHLARRVWRPGPLWLTTRAECRTYPELARAASRLKAALYVGHYPEGLAAAGVAARRHDAHLAYDAEDLHSDEDPQTPAGDARRSRVMQIERAHLSRCAYVSAVSDGVAAALSQRYGVAQPLVVHNTFPWADRETLDGCRKDRRSDVPTVYWYSQVIGPDRGLQDAIRALGLVRSPFELHVRGFHGDEMASRIRALAEEAGIANRVILHQRVNPAELLSRTAEHDIGLALEQPVSANRLLTVTNKMFFYMLAGLAVVATDTPGQRRIADQTPGVVRVYTPGDHLALAHILERLLSDPTALAAQRARALDAARDRWNWETEQVALVRAVNETIGGATEPGAATDRPVVTV
jgi:glycosyltransferase involved in cell wall biosynthesis